MSLLEQHLGRCLTAYDVASYLQCDVTTVYRHYRQLGGCKIGTSYKFFERGLIDSLNAVQDVPKEAPARRRISPPDRPAVVPAVRKPVLAPHGLL